uniref:Tudor domain-containing protein n=1 Tax=Romanomermis culicivorax TaxID=13658 RepID=A0A915IYU6_ROMCU
MLQSLLQDNCIRVWMDSCSKLNQEKKKLLQELIFCKLQIEKEPIPSNKDESVQTDEPLTSKNDVENAFVLKGIKKRIFIALKKIVNSPSPPHNLPLSFDHLSPLRQYGSLYLPAHLWYDLMESLKDKKFVSSKKSENDKKSSTPCIARRSGYYRGLVIDCERGLVAVHFVDYGDQYSLAVKDVFEIADEFVTQPAFALHSGLKAKIIDNDYPRSIYSPEELTIFRKMIENTKFVATLIDDKGGICRWKIYDQATKKCLAHSLLEAYSKAKRKPANKSTQCDTRILSSNEQNCRLICTPKSQSDTQYGFKRIDGKSEYQEEKISPPKLNITDEPIIDSQKQITLRAVRRKSFTFIEFPMKKITPFMRTKQPTNISEPWPVDELALGMNPIENNSLFTRKANCYGPPFVQFVVQLPPSRSALLVVGRKIGAQFQSVGRPAERMPPRVVARSCSAEFRSELIGVLKGGVQIRPSTTIHLSAEVECSLIVHSNVWLKTSLNARFRLEFWRKFTIITTCRQAFDSFKKVAITATDTHRRWRYLEFGIGVTEGAEGSTKKNFWRPKQSIPRGIRKIKRAVVVDREAKIWIAHRTFSSWLTRSETFKR